jgi:non-heme chloroperoxidase
MYYGRGPANRLLVNTDIFDFYTVENAPAFENSHTFAAEFAPKDMDALQLVLFDHILNFVFYQFKQLMEVATQ